MIDEPTTKVTDGKQIEISSYRSLKEHARQASVGDIIDSRVRLDSLGSQRVRFETIEKRKDELNSVLSSHQSDIYGSAP